MSGLCWAHGEYWGERCSLCTSPGLHARIAAVLGWTEAEAKTLPLRTLRDLIRPLGALKLVHEIDDLEKSGRVIVGEPASKGRRIGMSEQDVVFVLHSETNHTTDAVTTSVAALPVLKRGKGFVAVERCSASKYRKHIYDGSFYDHREDAVAAYAEQVGKIETALSWARADLERMREELKS